MTSVNDVHSRLNATDVRRVDRPRSSDEVQRALSSAARDGLSVIATGGRHSMGGQQFVGDGVLLDMTEMRRLVNLDGERGTVEVEAGIDWAALIDALVTLQANRAQQWGIVQKPTGADGLTIGGSLSSNVHGRGLTLPPMIQDVEAFVLVDATGVVRSCSREENVELFGLAIGGYGLFGVITSVTLRLSPRRKLERVVEWVDVDDLIGLFDERIADGFLYGDCQFSIDSGSPDFLDGGIFSCYRPVDSSTPIVEGRALSHEDWQRLLYLAHVDKAQAGQRYREHYLATSGQIYWSDLQQRSDYVGGYHPALDAVLGASVPGSEMITELYVPREQLAVFMHDADGLLTEASANVIYGTIRLIEPDRETFLRWARDRFACIIFNLHVAHDEAGIASSAKTFRGLIDLAIAHGGSYYLTYHRFASREQVAACYPSFEQFLALKAAHDPAGLFQSDWYRHQRALFGPPQ
jgi:FAD/FMN-containing dehydrogenase